MKKLDPITPGEILKEEFLDPINLNMRQLAVSIGVPDNRISQIVSGKREISADTALRLGKFFKTGPEFWLNLQTRYNLILEEESWKKIEKNIPECDLLVA